MNKAAVGLMLLLLGAAAFPDTRSGERSAIWTPLGPAGLRNVTTNGPPVVSGRVDVAVSDPMDANVIYVGAGSGGSNVVGGGGVWKTTNYLTADPAGPTWVPLTDDFPSFSIFGKSLALYPGNPDILYAAASGPNGGVLKTVDGGTHWEYLFSDLFSGALFSALVIHPTDPNTIYVGVRGIAAGGPALEGGVYRLTFTDSGSTWRNLTSEVAPGSVATDVLIDPTDSLVLYVGLVRATDANKNGVYRSTDGGESWQLLTNGLLSGSQVGEWIALAMAPSSPQTVYTTIFKPDNSSSNPSLERFLTTNAGATWSMLHPPPMANGKQDYRSWHVVLGVDPKAPNVVYANATEPFFIRSTDFGQTWATLYRCEDPVNAYFDSTGALALVGDRGIQRAVAPSDCVPEDTCCSPAFVSRQGNLGNFLFYNVTLDPRNLRRGFGVGQDQLYLAKFTGAPRWTYVQGIGFEFGKALIDPHDPSIVYSLAPLRQTFVTRSTDGGTQWTDISNGIDRSEFDGTGFREATSNAIALDEHQPSRLVLGGQRVWQTLDRGENWTQMGRVLSPGASITAIAIAQSQRDTVYAATEDGRFFATFDGGSNWVERDQGLPLGSANLTLDIVIDPAHPNHVFIQTSGLAAQGRVWMTNDGGSSWSRLDAGIPTNLLVLSLAVDWRFRHPILYAGTSRGVFFSTDAGMNWSLFGQGLPCTMVLGFQILPKNGMLVAATFGRGVYQIPLAIPRR